jgi:hypothetical protein
VFISAWRVREASQRKGILIWGGWSACGAVGRASEERRRDADDQVKVDCLGKWRVDERGTGGGVESTGPQPGVMATEEY